MTCFRTAPKGKEHPEGMGKLGLPAGTSDVPLAIEFKEEARCNQNACGLEITVHPRVRAQ